MSEPPDLSDPTESPAAPAAAGRREAPPPAPAPVRNRLRRIGLFAGPLLAALAYILLPDVHVDASGSEAVLGHAGRATAALAVWMAVWWMTEAIPVYATALLPLALLPLFRAGTAREAASPYGNELIFLFLGGFLMALALQRWGADRRIAYRVLRLLGSRVDRLVFGFMAVVALLSMWISNTAAMLALYPVAVSVLLLVHEDDSVAPASRPAVFRNLSHCLLLGLAYGASIGGMGTLIGTPPNLFLASFARENLGIEIGFFQWMLLGVPLVAVFLPLAWMLLVRVFPVRGLRLEGVGTLVARALETLGPPSRGERLALGVFGFAVCAWMFRPLLAGLEVGGIRPFAGLTDSGIAILAALSLFVLPAGPESGSDAASPRRAVMDWESAKALPFGLLLLFGGGLSLAAALERNGVTAFIGAQLGGLDSMPAWAFIALAVLVVPFVSELTSNTATAAILIPVSAAVATGMGLDPMLLLVPITLAASNAYMLPVATPPNAIAYGSGRVEATAMVRAGILLDLLGVAVILTVVSLLAGHVF